MLENQRSRRRVSPERPEQRSSPEAEGTQCGCGSENDRAPGLAETRRFRLLVACRDRRGVCVGRGSAEDALLVICQELKSVAVEDDRVDPGKERDVAGREGVLRERVAWGPGRRVTLVEPAVDGGVEGLVEIDRSRSEPPQQLNDRL